jgi:Tol biopolymer transport system component
LDVQPHDTAVFVGGSYRLRVIATDNSGNRVQSPPRYRVVPAIAAVDTAGILTGLATGRARIEVLLDDTTIVRRVSVVPGLTLAGNVNQDLVEFGADGGSFRTLVAGMGEVSGLTWSPDASELLFTTPNGFTGVMRAVNRMTKQLRVVGGWFPWDPIWPQYAARDGRIYFMAIPTLVGYGGYGIWRVNPDGTGFEQLTAPTVAGHGDWHPSVSPDGNTVVFALERGAGLSGAQLAFLDLGQGTVRTTATLGFLPRWSPDGRTIAYLNNGEVKLADPSGNELRTLTPLGSYGGELVWSRDGRWLVTVGDSGTTIIDAQNGTAMPLDFARFRAVPR